MKRASKVSVVFQAGHSCAKCWLLAIASANKPLFYIRIDGGQKNSIGVDSSDLAPIKRTGEHRRRIMLQLRQREVRSRTRA
jgi:hypothetical protein